MKKLIIFIQLFIFMRIGIAQTLTGDEILQKVDQNITADTKILKSKMIIHGRRASRTVESRSWIRGIKQSFTEYLAPARDAGTKMLKLADELWTYSPSSDRTIKISGHLLRQSVMGSDLSYEDLMEGPELTKLYQANVAGEEELHGRSCWILELVARTEGVTYHTRKLWVDKERFVLHKEARYAKSGKLLKTTEIKTMKKLNNRWVAEHIIFKDELKEGQGTEFIIDDIQFNQPIPEHLFSKAALKK